MTFCTSCGTSLGPRDLFCPRCGTGIAGGDAVATVPMRTSDTARDAMLAALRHATLGDYEILAELGRGGMATVYLAHDIALDRKVAIKVLAPALLLMGEGMIERFKREARTAAALSHPHIIPIYAVKVSDRLLYFVMKHVQGRSLDAIIHEVGPLPIPMVQTILAQVGDALAYAHRHGVIHRDIKSANIMLDEEGWAVVTDFGIAKVEQAQGLTMTGVTVGTPAYMSPEQCANREISGASDQYSLGIVAYEMLTGQLPFKSDSTMSVMYAHFNMSPQPVTELRADCPPNLSAAVMRMLEKEPEARWPSMDDVVAVCGRPTLRRDDPIRTEMITLAKASSPARLLRERTPTSPLALARSRLPTAVTPTRRTTARWWIGAGALGVLALATLGWWVVPRLRHVPPPAAADTALAPPPPPLAGPAAETTAVQQVPATDKTRGAGAPARQSGAQRAAPAARGATRQDDSIMGSLRATALAAMQRAAGAGATAAELARGDTMLRGADSLAHAGRLSEATVQFLAAASQFNETERIARARAARDSAALAQARRPAPVPVPVPAAAPAPVNPRPAIDSVIAAYARALETRDIREVRRAYPGLTSAQQQGWEDLFRASRSFKARLTVSAVDVRGSAAEATVKGTYDFDNTTTGRVEQRPVTFHATLVADSAGWRLSAIH
ncbi:MAG TPA: serine/threonine-protein kinase [Gemmatimonadales bacterium]